MDTSLQLPTEQTSFVQPSTEQELDHSSVDGLTDLLYDVKEDWPVSDDGKKLNYAVVHSFALMSN